jgi:outer membrane protein
MSLRSTLIALSAAVTVGLPALAAAEVKLGYVDYQRVLLEVSDGKAARTRFQQWAEERKKEMEKEGEALRKELDLLQKQASAMSEEVRASRALEFQKRAQAFEQKGDRLRSEMAEREQKEIHPIREKILQVVNRIAEREGLSLVLDSGAGVIVYALPQLDITNEVVRGYESLPKSAAPVAKDAPKKDTPKK